MTLLFVWRLALCPCHPFFDTHALIPRARTSGQNKTLRKNIMRIIFPCRCLEVAMNDKKAQTRERILQAASNALIQRGPVEPSVSEVMGAAGLTVGGFYAHFE